jgi:hypothetical protein
MKQILLAVLWLHSIAAIACDACGASAGNQGLGLLPQQYKYYAALQYQYRSFSTMHEAEGSQAATVSSEQYRTTQLWGRVSLSNRIMLFAFVPYQMNLRTEALNTVQYSGVGDVSVIANGVVVKPKCDAQFSHTLLAGAGIKMPTGKHDAINAETGMHILNMQPGTGSWDMMFNANYTLSYHQMGINSEIVYTATTANKAAYKYGDRVLGTLLYFYRIQKQKWSVIPQAGIRYEYALHDYDNYYRKWLNEETGGSTIYGSLSIQAFCGHIGAQVACYIPASQNYAQGRVNARQRLDAGIFILF